VQCTQEIEEASAWRPLHPACRHQRNQENLDDGDDEYRNQQPVFLDDDSDWVERQQIDRQKNESTPKNQSPGTP